MTAIAALDLNGIVDTAIRDVFDTMLSLPIDVLAAPGSDDVEGRRFVGAVSFTGSVIGSIKIQVGHGFASLICADMLGMELDELDGEEDIKDVIGELSNMIGGDLKSRLCDQGLTCELSIPSITSGTDFAVEDMGWLRHERVAFRHAAHTALVDVFIKPTG